MASVPFHYVDLRAFSYATEDESRVGSALRTVLPLDIEAERAVVEGHHGDRIVVLSARIETADGIRYVLDRIRELDDLSSVVAELDERVDDDCSLFLSLDKQAAYRGEIELGDGIAVRAKVEAYPAKRSTAIENARRALRPTSDA